MAGSEDPTASYLRRLPAERPGGLRLSVVRRPWYRLDAQPPGDWNWEPYPKPRSRFDSAAGAFRLRYAGDAMRVALRERFDESRRTVRETALRQRLVELSGPARVVDLRKDHTLDALGVDDQISTGRSPGIWEACHHLADLVHEWFGERCDGIVYRSRTTPQHCANLAFFGHATFAVRDLGPLGEQRELLLDAVAKDGFTIQGWR